jgi:hypothetical protein
MVKLFQGCNNLYYSQLGNRYFASVQQSNEPKIETQYNNTLYVADIPLICDTVESWCDYCNTTQYDHPVLPHPNYTCSFTTTVDICTFDNGLLANESFCINADINSTTATVTTTEVAEGRSLLQGLAIEEIGEAKVYRILFHHAAAYLGIYIILRLLFNRRKSHRWFNCKSKK